MKITRVGARANNGPSSITLSNLNAGFVLKSNEVSLTDRDVADFVTKAHYNYDIRLSLSEVGKIIEAVSLHGHENSNEVAKALGPYIKHLIRLTNMCANDG